MSSGERAPLVVNGLTVFAHPLFLSQLETLARQVEALQHKDPKGYAKKIFGKNASSSRSVCVEDHKGAVLLHLELASEGDRELVAKALAGVCKAPLRR